MANTKTGETPNTPLAPIMQTAPEINKEIEKRGNADLILRSLDDMPNDNFKPVSGSYLKFNEKTTYNFVVEGLSKMENTINPDQGDGTIDAVSFVGHDEEGNVVAYVNADKVFVSAIQKLVAQDCAFPVAIRVQTGIKEKAANSANQYLRMQVSRLQY